jgi:thymidylate synthase ThyX
MHDAFMEIITRSEDIYKQIARLSPLAAGYILTNAHRRRVSMKINARELYHIARLRADKHAQWDIRKTAAEMMKLGKESMPLALMLATGKDDFASLYNLVFASESASGNAPSNKP